MPGRMSRSLDRLRVDHRATGDFAVWLREQELAPHFSPV
jgi:hypothetical protein